MGDNDRSHTGGRFQLEIDGYNVGFLKKFSGLSMEADIATHDLGPHNVQMKHVANRKWTPAKATIGVGMGKGMYEWIRASFKNGFETRGGAFTAGDFNYKAQSRVDFKFALITSVTVPKLAGDSKEAAYFDVEFEAEEVRWSKAGGEDIKGQIGTKQKAWLCSNFRVEIDDMPCNRVYSVDSFTWKCSIAPDPIGTTLEATKHPAKVTVPELKLSISHADHPEWAKWAHEWFVMGQHEAQHEKGGRIVFLDPTTKNELGEIKLIGVGIKKFADDDSEANSEKIKRFNVELYVEQMEFLMKYTDA
jgi:hypothetical protein